MPLDVAADRRTVDEHAPPHSNADKLARIQLTEDGAPAYAGEEELRLLNRHEWFQRGRRVT